MLPLKPICERKNIRKDGTSIIFIQFCFSAENRTLLNTEIAIPPAFWNKKRLCISNDLPFVFGNAVALNEELKRLIRLSEDIIALADQKGIVNRGAFVKETFRPHFDLKLLEYDFEKIKIDVENKTNQINLNLYYQVEDYIKCKQNKVCKETIGVYGQMKHHLQAFEIYRTIPITFQSFDFAFYEAFTEFLSFEYIQKRRKQTIKGLKTNSIAKTIKHLRLFIRDRIKRKIVPPIDLSDFKVIEEETDAIYLTEKEITLIYELDLSHHPHLDKYRDLLVFGCLTGMRFSDFSEIDSNDVRDNKLYKKQEKSEHWVVIPLKRIPNKIFTQTFSGKIPKITNPDFNYYIKEVGKLAGLNAKITFSHKNGNQDVKKTKPKYEWITSHTCRRSFCTNEFLAGTPV